MDIDSDYTLVTSNWPKCRHRSEETGSACTGRQVDGFAHCLAHLEPQQLNHALRQLHPGADLEAPGTDINAELFRRILQAVSIRNRPVFGAVTFTQAHFFEMANFTEATFGGYTTFDGARFSGDALFSDAKFGEEVHFDGAQFSSNAWFFGAWFSQGAFFPRAQFGGEAWFEDTQFGPGAQFVGARFEKATSVGPMVGVSLRFEQAVFMRAVVIEAAAMTVACRDTTWELGVTMRLRYAKVNLERATFTVPSFVTGADQQFGHPDSEPVNEDEVRTRVPGAEQPAVTDDLWVPVMLSLRGVDAFNLSVTDVDLSQCRFAGARLLDQLRLEGRCIFAYPPPGFHTGWALPPAWRWSRRQSLAEERGWRATTTKYAGWADTRSGGSAEVRPERLAGLYRQLRKAQEDAKNEPGAADFYYGEMEMRRHARTTPAAERTIVWLYWLISGYGLRALRSLAMLFVLGVIVTTVLIGWGLAATAPTQHLTGTVAPDNPARIDATLRTAPSPLPPASQRWTGQRTRTALQVTLESIVFRSTNKPLTTTGTWTTIAARILGPVLLVLTLLAVRNRVRR